MISPGNAPPRTKQNYQRPRTGNNRASPKDPAFSPGAGYSKAELFELWQNFKDQHDAVRCMMDFSLLDKPHAEQLISEFRARLEKRAFSRPPDGKIGN